MFYSASTKGFYDFEANGANMPSDAVEITEAYHQQLLAEESGGKIISPDGEGRPVAVARIEQALVPASITPRQGWIVLSRAGLLESVQAAIAGMEGQAGEEARIEWKRATYWSRSWPLLESIARGLGLTNDQIDALFVQAAQI